MNLLMNEMLWPVIIAAFGLLFFGASVASFYCLCVSRVQALRHGSSLLKGKTFASLYIKTDSYCFSCGHKLKAYELIPLLSYLLLLGKCSSCKTKIPLNGFVTELAVGISFSCIGLAAYHEYYPLPLNPALVGLPLLLVGVLLPWLPPVWAGSSKTIAKTK